MITVSNNAHFTLQFRVHVHGHYFSFPFAYLYKCFFKQLSRFINCELLWFTMFVLLPYTSYFIMNYLYLLPTIEDNTKKKHKCVKNKKSSQFKANANAKKWERAKKKFDNNALRILKLYTKIVKPCNVLSFFQSTIFSPGRQNSRLHLCSPLP